MSDILDALVSHARETVPMYRSLYSELDLGLVNHFCPALPLVRRNVIQNAGRDALSDGFRVDALRSELTSGTQGIPLTCYKTREEQMLAGIALWRRRALWDESAHASRVAYFSHLGEGVGCHRNAKELYLSPFLLSRSSIAHYRSLLESWQPRWIHGTPSVVAAFAYLCSGSRRPRLQLSYIEVASEFLHSWQRSLIEDVFDAPVVSHYGCREVWTIGMEEPCGHMHVALDNVYVEVTAEGGGGGTEAGGAIVVTSLHNRAMPFIRYELPDEACLKLAGGACSGKGPIVVLKSGRRGGAIKVGDKFIGSTLLIRGLSLELARTPSWGVAQFRVVREETFKFVVEVVCEASVWSRVESRVRDYMLRRLGSNLSVACRRREFIEPDRSGKVREYVDQIDAP